MARQKAPTEAVAPMTVRGIPTALRLAVKSKAAAEGVSLQAKLIQLMTDYARAK